MLEQEKFININTSSINNYFKKLYPFIIAIVLFYIALPIMADDWYYGSILIPNPLFYMNKGIHPGRHISELLIYFSEQILGGILGAIFTSSLWGIKIAHGLSAGLVAFGFWIASSWYGIFEYKNNRISKIYLYSLVLFSFSLPMFLFVYNYYMMNIASLMLGLFTWYPFVYYYRYQNLPTWMSNYSYSQIIGLYIVIFYSGTQIHDISNFTFLGMSLMFAIYLIGRSFVLKQKESSLLYILLILHIIFGFYSILRNVFLSIQTDCRVSKTSFNLIHIINNIYIGGEYSFNPSIFYYLSLVFVGVICMYYIIKWLKNRKIEFFDYYIFSTQVVGVVVILGMAILNSYYTAPLWILWIVQLSILLSLFYQKQKIVSLLLPILYLSTLVYILRLFHFNHFLSTLINKSADTYLVQLFKEAEQTNADEVLISSEKVTSIMYNPYFNNNVSIWMFHQGYTTKKLPIKIITTNE